MQIDIEREQEVGGYQLVLGYMGVILMLIGIIILLPLLILFIYPEEIDQAKYFILPGVSSILMGYLFTFLIKGKPKGSLRRHHDTVIVVISWLSAIFLTALPFILTGEYNFTQAIFETTSGWSTTGLSVVDVTTAPKIFLIHRTIILFFGGVGLVLIMVSVLSDSSGMNLYSAEGHSDRLLPNLVKSSRTIMAIYAGYILGGTILYVIFGMSLFDAFNHSVAALSTGGFSTRAESIGYYSSRPIEIVTIVLMLLGGTNFLAHLFLIKGKFKAFFGYCEVRFQLFISALAAAIMAPLLLIGAISNSIGDSIFDALFQVVSALTTTGFQTIPSFTAWPSSAILIMIVLQLIGGGTGSTAGGIKQIRVYTMLKDIVWGIRNKYSNKRVVRANYIKRPDKNEFIGNSEKSEIGSYIFLYFVIFLAGTFVLTCFGNGIKESMFEFSSAISTVGLSMGITSYDAHPVILWTEIIGMFVGRLEIYVVLLALIRIASDLKNTSKKFLRK